jgi:Tfp pilus assembly protein PilN
MINLLPPQEKEILRQEEKYKSASILGILFLVFLICLILILFSIKISISGEVEAQKILLSQEEERFKGTQTQNLEEKIISSNQILSKLNSFYYSQISLTGVLEKISRSLPSGVYLTTFNFSSGAPSGSGQISLSGFSPNREILLEFKKNLEKEENFQEIYFPPSNWVKPTDIDFLVTFQIKK